MVSKPNEPPAAMLPLASIVATVGSLKPLPTASAPPEATDQRPAVVEPGRAAGEATARMPAETAVLPV